MATRYSMQRRLRMNRPSLRLRAKPPKLRTARGEDFTAANLGVALSMQFCAQCGQCNYPPRELCGNCLNDDLHWQQCEQSGHLLEAVELQHSLWEFYKRKLSAKRQRLQNKDAGWPIASVKLAAGPVVFTHLAAQLFEPVLAGQLNTGLKVQVFSHSDYARQSVLITVPAAVDISSAKARTDIIEEMGLLTAAIREDQQ